MARTCMKYREMRRKYPDRVRHRCSSCGGPVVISGDLGCAGFVSVNMRWKGKSLAS